jgi:hypothetical protein
VSYVRMSHRTADTCSWKSWKGTPRDADPNSMDSFLELPKWVIAGTDWRYHQIFKNCFCFGLRPSVSVAATSVINGQIKRRGRIPSDDWAIRLSMCHVACLRVGSTKRKCRKFTVEINQSDVGCPLDLVWFELDFNNVGIHLLM